jgi:hypothetical protein
MAWKIFRTAIDQWFVHRSARLGAALAYYSVFSMGPLLLIVISVAGFFFGADAVRGNLTAQFRSLLGDTGSKAVEAMRQLAAHRPIVSRCRRQVTQGSTDGDPRRGSGRGFCPWRAVEVVIQ